jgi:hypothetical protein
MIFEPKSEVDWSWRELNNDEIHNLYYSPNVVRAIKAKEVVVGGACGTHGGGGKYLQGFGCEARRKETIGRPRRRWEYNIKMDLSEIGIDEANWIRLAQERVQ